MEPISKPFQEPFGTPSLQTSSLPPMAKPAADRKARPRRVREVSSRYMTTPSHAAPPSPIAPFPDSGDTQFPNSRDPCRNAAAAKHPSVPPPKYPHRQEPRRRDPVPLSSAGAVDSNAEPDPSFPDENQPPLAQLGLQGKAAETERRRAVRLFADDGVEEPFPLQQPKVKPALRRPRPGTPAVADRVSVAGTGSAGIRPGLLTPVRGSSSPSEVAMRSLGELSHSPVLGQKKSARRAVSNIRASTVGSEFLPTGNGGLGRHLPVEDSARRSAWSLCHRSLSFASSSLQQPSFNPTKSVSRPLASSRDLSSTANPVALCLPPQAPKLGTSLGKARKGLHRLEDVHSLCRLYNCHLQWRFINAKAQAAVHSRTIAAQKSLFGTCNKISELRDSVALKKIELERLQRARSLQAIVQAQMPLLDEWTNVEGCHTNSLAEAAKALQDALLRLPISGDVVVDIVGISDVLESAVKMMEESSSCIGKFLPKAEEVENIILDLVKVIIREKVLIEECGDLLSVAHGLQVKECSLRSQLIQLKQTNSK